MPSRSVFIRTYRSPFLWMRSHAMLATFWCHHYTKLQSSMTNWQLSYTLVTNPADRNQDVLRP